MTSALWCRPAIARGRHS